MQVMGFRPWDLRLFVIVFVLSCIGLLSTTERIFSEAMVWN